MHRMRSWPRISRWMGLSAAMLMMGCNGLTYTFAVYSEFIKKQLHYSQEQADDLGAAKDFGAIFGLLSGLIYFFFSPWVSVIIGACMHFTGYIGILLALTERMKASFLMLCIFSAMGPGGDAFVDTACIMTILESFRDQKGAAIGLLKSQLGLSAAIFVMVYKAFMGSTVVNFLVLISLVPSVVYCGLAFLIRSYVHDVDEADQSDASQRITLVSVIVVILGVFLMGVMIVEDNFSIHELYEKFLVQLMLLILVAMVLVPLFSKPIDLLRLGLNRMFCRVFRLHHVAERDKNVFKSDDDKESDLDEEGIPLKSDVFLELEAEAREERKTEKKEDDNEEEDVVYPSTWESLQGINFWLIIIVVSSGAGSGLAIMNNFAQIGKAVKSDAVEEFVGIISIWSCFGRLASGYGSDLMMKAGYPRPLCLLISQTATCVCCLILSTGSIPLLFVGAAVTGLAYGSYWTLAPTILSEVFGLRQVATLYKLLGLGPTVGSYILSGKVLGYLYDRESIKYRQQQGDIVEENACYGRQCFETGLLALAFVCFVGVVACLWFTHRTRKFYRRFGHLQHSQS